VTAIKDVTGTAFIVAEFRSQENASAHPLYSDPIVSLFLDDRTKAAADAISRDFPAAPKNLRLRTRYFDDRLDEAIARSASKSSSSAQASTPGPSASARRGWSFSRSTTPRP